MHICDHRDRRSHTPGGPVQRVCKLNHGLRPAEGHETLDVVRELAGQRVWCAAPRIAAAAAEVRPRIAQARQWAESLGVPVGLWISDKPEAVVTGVAAESPDVPHRYGDNHSLRDLAQPVPEAASRAEVRMRKRVRGLRTIEPAVPRRREARVEPAPGTEAVTDTAAVTDPAPTAADPAGSVGTGYRAAVRGIRTDDPGGPWHPPGVRMAEALAEVEASIRRDPGAPTGGSRRSDSAASPAASGRGATRSETGNRSSGTTSR
jgi:hypothetical protein